MIRKSWWVDFRVEHTRYRKRSPENSRAGAQAYELALRQRFARGETMLALQRPTFGEFSTKWFHEYVLPNNKPSEQRTKKLALKNWLVPFFGAMPIDKIAIHDIERFKAKLLAAGLSRKTVNNRLSTLRTCLHTAYEWLNIPGGPPKVLWLKCPPPRTDYLTPEECVALLAHSRGTIHEMILTAIRTGMRQGELKGLQWSSIDWLNRSLVVRHTYSEYTKALGSPKGNRERHIPLDIDVLEMLGARKQETGYVFLNQLGRPYTFGCLRDGLVKACDRARLRRIGWHTLRHTFASHLAMNGTPLHVVQALLGHANITMTMRYAHVAPSALRVAIELANPRTAGPVQPGQQAGNRWQESQVGHRTLGAGVEKDTEIMRENSDTDLLRAA